MFSREEKKGTQDVSHSSNIISKGTILEGNIKTHGNVRVEGKIIGHLITKSKAALGASSTVEGNILAQNAEISGEVKGKVEVSEMLVLRPSSVIHGDIVTNKLIVESGATFNGGCKMGAVIKEIKVVEQSKDINMANTYKEYQDVQPQKAQGYKPA